MRKVRSPERRAFYPRKNPSAFSLIGAFLCVACSIALLINGAFFNNGVGIFAVKKMATGRWEVGAHRRQDLDLIVVTLVFGEQLGTRTIHILPYHSGVNFTGPTPGPPNPFFTDPARLTVAFRAWFLAVPLSAMAFYFWRRALTAPNAEPPYPLPPPRSSPNPAGSLRQDAPAKRARIRLNPRAYSGRKLVLELECLVYSGGRLVFDGRSFAHGYRCEFLWSSYG